MTSALVHQAALLICESEVEWHLISTHQHMAYRTGMMSKSFLLLLFKSSKFITTHRVVNQQQQQRTKRIKAKSTQKIPKRIKNN